jgi:AmmeMemoRadiSam system protein A
MNGPADPQLAAPDGLALVQLAAATVRARLTGKAPDGQAPRSTALRALGSSFVTLERCGRLRGCIGSLEAARPLYRDVMRNAVRAMADPRMKPVTSGEWPELEVSVSVLGRPKPMDVCGLAELREMLRPHVDGLILTVGARQATFLPAVWKKLPDPGDFIAALLAKGGWVRDRWPVGLIVRRYTAAEFYDERPHEPL